MKPLDAASIHERWLATLPPDGRARLQEPADEELVPLPHSSLVGKHLPAKDRPATPAPFLSIHALDAAAKHAWWSNLPHGIQWWGDGDGLYRFKEHPRWLAWLRPRPRVTIRHSAEGFPEFWAASRAFVASPRACELIRRLEPAIATVDIDYSFADGASRDGYVLLDFVARHHAYDFMRSDVTVLVNDGRRRLELGTQRTIRDDIPTHVHAFRGFHEVGLFFSRELAEQLEPLAQGQLWYFDDNLGAGVPLEEQRIRAKRARARSETEAQPPGPQPRQVWSQLRPLQRNCDLIAAERLLMESLRATPASPYHIACDLRIETPRETVAEYFDSYLAGARRNNRVAVVYCEMNGFTINPDEWYCDAFGFQEDGGRDDYGWLGNFSSSADESLIIQGLEPLQKVFAESMLLDARDSESRDAQAFAARLVVVRFQRMLQDALPLMRNMDVPLLAAAHDEDDPVEIRPPAP
jgi:hypothetical protein